MPFERSHVYTVTEFTDEIKYLLEDQFGVIEIRGEVSQPKVSRNGHLYFTLKDAGAQLPCVMWYSSRTQLESEPDQGREIVATGSLQVYAPHGRYQMIVTAIRRAGIGKLQQAFEELKKKLEAEGLFDPSRKKKLPALPGTIGVVTSSASAAFQDIRQTLEKRFPLCRLLLYHAAVQGPQAAPQIAEGIRYLSEQTDADVLIVGRGGGSLEDLWAFNEEVVARAIAECPVPVISAVGHETDFSISDFVADVRAATPTQAVILAVPDRNDLRMRIEELQLRLDRLVSDRVERYRDTVSRFLDNYALHRVKQRIDRHRELLQWQQDRMLQLLRNRIHRIGTENISLAGTISHRTHTLMLKRKADLNGMTHRLAAADPNAPLKKGYTRIWQDNLWVRKSGNFAGALPYDIEWHDGRARCVTSSGGSADTSARGSADTSARGSASTSEKAR